MGTGQRKERSVEVEAGPVDIDTIFAVVLVSMFPRHLTPPSSSFFLLGPRGTGKSTWLREHFPEALVVNLLGADTMLRYQRDPSLLRAEVLAQPRERWIVIDEVQRAPRLLDEVHLLMEEHRYKRFALTGSSARKLKRGAANLLAGRAVVCSLFPLTSAETGFTLPVERMLRYGSMPLSVTRRTMRPERSTCAFVTTYLTEEIRAEALVRDLGAFSRVVEVSALAAGQRTNVSAIARDAGISRETVRGFFEVLTDTLIASWLPAWRPRARVKETALPKLFWFDPGVLHAASGGFDQPLPADRLGVLLEHLVLHELRSRMHYAEVRGSLGYWATPGGNEVDFVWSRTPVPSGPSTYVDSKRSAVQPRPPPTSSMVATVRCLQARRASCRLKSSSAGCMPGRSSADTRHLTDQGASAAAWRWAEAAGVSGRGATLPAGQAEAGGGRGALRAFTVGVAGDRGLAPGAATPGGSATSWRTAATSCPSRCAGAPAVGSSTSPVRQP